MIAPLKCIEKLKLNIKKVVFSFYKVKIEYMSSFILSTIKKKREKVNHHFFKFLHFFVHSVQFSLDLCLILILFSFKLVFIHQFLHFNNPAIQPTTIHNEKEKA